MARFLFATMPIPGHVASIAPVVRALVDRGHQVIWYTSAFQAEKVAGSGAEFSPIVSTLDFGDADYDRHYPERVKHEGLQKLIFDFEHVFVGSVEGYVTDLRALIASNHPDALVVDPAVAAGWVIAETDGLPTAIVNITVLSLEGPGVAPFGLGLPPNSSLLGRVRNKALYALVDRVIFRKVNRAYRRLARAHGWPVLPFRPHATRWLYLQPSVPALEYPQVTLPPQLHFIGPLLPAPADACVLRALPRPARGEWSSGGQPDCAGGDGGGEYGREPPAHLRRPGSRWGAEAPRRRVDRFRGRPGADQRVVVGAASPGRRSGPLGRSGRPGGRQHGVDAGALPVAAPTDGASAGADAALR
jgi:hypothetical protein